MFCTVVNNSCVAGGEPSHVKSQRKDDERALKSRIDELERRNRQSERKARWRDDYDLVRLNQKSESHIAVVEKRLGSSTKSSFDRNKEPQNLKSYRAHQKYDGRARRGMEKRRERQIEHNCGKQRPRKTPRFGRVE